MQLNWSKQTIKTNTLVINSCQSIMIMRKESQMREKWEMRINESKMREGAYLKEFGIYLAVRGLNLLLK